MTTTQGTKDNRCAACHRDAHRPGMPTENHGHAYVAPHARRFQALGRQAFTDGLTFPLQDPEVLAAIDGMPVGTGAADIMRAWSRGWTAANLAAPIALEG